MIVFLALSGINTGQGLHNGFSMLGQDDPMKTKPFDDAPSEEGPPIALGTSLALEIDGVAERLSGILVGIVPGECLIVRGQFESLEGQGAEGRTITVQYSREGAANSFASEFMGAITTPLELAFIAYPEEIEAIELRAHKRRECFLPAELVVRNEIYAGAIQDISEKGCKFILDVSGGRESPAIEGSEQVILVVEAPEGEERQEIAGEARNVHFNAEFDAEEMQVGIKFQDEAPESLKSTIENTLTPEPF
jgi:hypothetical protein